MKILVDADACPVKSIIENVAKDFNIEEQCLLIQVIYWNLIIAKSFK